MIPWISHECFKQSNNREAASGPEWLSSHPNPGNRYQRISDESKKLTVAQAPQEQPIEQSSRKFNRP